MQTIIWTALPNGMTIVPEEGGARLRLSVFVSPRLYAARGRRNVKLGEYPDWLDWPARTSDITFEVQFDNRPPVPANRVQPEAEPPPSDMWTVMFDGDTYVKAYEFPDTESVQVRSFPVKNVVAHIKTAYQTLAVESPTEPPKLEMRPEVHTEAKFEPAVGFFRAIAPSAQETVQINRQVDTHLRATRAKAIANPVVEAAGAGKTRVRTIDAASGMAAAVGPLAGKLSQATFDFYQLKHFHGMDRATTLQGVALERQRVAIERPEMDFHSIVASLGEYPGRNAQARLVIDLEVPVQS